jgi:hypothetical protein
MKIQKDDVVREVLGDFEEVEIDKRGEIMDEKTIEKKFILNGPRFFPEAERCKDSTDFREATLAVAMRCMLGNSDKRVWKWLDLACGRGNLIEHCQESFECDCGKIHYYGIDKCDRYKSEFELFVEEKDIRKNLRSAEFKIVDFTSWKNCFEESKGLIRYDWVSFVNVLHEVNPKEISAILLSMIKLCEEDGFLYLCDIEELIEFEADAVIWSLDEIKEIFNILFVDFKSFRFNRLVPTFSIIAKRSDLKKDIDVNTLSQANEINKKIQGKFKRLLRKKKQHAQKKAEKIKKQLAFNEENKKSRNSDLILSYYLEMCRYYKIDQVLSNFKPYDLDSDSLER